MKVMIASQAGEKMHYRAAFENYGGKEHDVFPGNAIDLTDKPDLILIPGGRDHEPPTNETVFYKNMFHAAVMAGIPLTGICGGHQLGCSYYGYPIYTMPGTVIIDGTVITDKGKKVMVGHHQFIHVDNVYTLDVIDTYGDMVYAFHLPDYKFLGVQFHPDWDHEGNCGRDYYHELLRKYLNV